MSNSALNQGVLQAKVNNVQNAADTSAVYSAGVWSFKNSTAVTSVTITDGGNVGIGTTGPGSKLEVWKDNVRIGNDVTSGVYGLQWWRAGSERGRVALDASASLLELQADGEMRFLTAGENERMRIDASGNLLVGKTSVDLTTSGMSFTTGASGLRVVSGATTGASDAFEAYSSGASAYRFYVSFAGQIFATSTTITGISDERLKENIRDLDEGLNTVLALKPRKFDWKEGKGANIKNARGFIAQEFEQVLPDMIEEWKDPAPEGEEPYKAVNANLIPTLVKAIQELSAKVDAQAAEIEALKAK